MAEKKKPQSIKSAYERALERLGTNGGPPPTLSEKQKDALAGVDREIRAKIAELEIMLGQDIVVARAGGDFEKAAELEEDRVRRIAKLNDEAETRKNAIREGT